MRKLAEEIAKKFEVSEKTRIFGAEVDVKSSHCMRAFHRAA